MPYALPLFSPWEWKQRTSSPLPHPRPSRVDRRHEPSALFSFHLRSTTLWKHSPEQRLSPTLALSFYRWWWWMSASTASFSRIWEAVRCVVRCSRRVTSARRRERDRDCFLLLLLLLLFLLDRSSTRVGRRRSCVRDSIFRRRSRLHERMPAPPFVRRDQCSSTLGSGCRLCPCAWTFPPDHHPATSSSSQTG